MENPEKTDNSTAHRAIKTTINSSSAKNIFDNTFGKIIGTSQKTLYKYYKFQLQIDANDELACWSIICR